MPEEIDFLAVGDMVVDDFIRLENAHVNCKINTSDCEICMPFGAKVPFSGNSIIYAVGNSPNASVSAACLGLKSALLTNAGADEHGRECLEKLKGSGVKTDLVKLHQGLKTNYHYVLWYGDERTILIKHEEYPYTLPEIGSPRYLYLSSLGKESLAFHETLAKYLEKHPEIILSFQPGTYQIKFGKNALAKIYERAEILACNKEEAQTITEQKNDDPKVLANALSALGPKKVLLTDGPRGAYLLSDGDFYFMLPYPDPKPPVERTGAGDAFASTFTASLAKGKDPIEAMRFAGINAMSVVQQVGAQAGLLDEVNIEHYLNKAPAQYYPTKIV